MNEGLNIQLLWGVISYFLNHYTSGNLPIHCLDAFLIMMCCCTHLFLWHVFVPTHSVQMEPLTLSTELCQPSTPIPALQIDG